MSENNALAANLLALIDLLEADEPVAWYEVEDRLLETPGWLHMVQRMRAPLPNASPYSGAKPDFGDSADIPENQRRQLAHYFWPYAILLDAQLAPGERARRLREDAEVDPVAFCKEQKHNGQPEIVTAAKEVLEACQQQASLLRGTSRASDSGNELLRTASAQDAAADALLHPASASAADSPSLPKRPWWRFRGRKSDG